MSYDNYLYLIDLNHNTAACLKGHQSFITNSLVSSNNLLVTAGCDHRVGLKNINKIQHWKSINPFSLKP